MCLMFAVCWITLLDNYVLIVIHARLYGVVNGPTSTGPKSDLKVKPDPKKPEN